MLIKDPTERRKQAIANREKLWRFLNLHTYSDLETMRHHLEFKTKAPVSKILARWCRDGLARKFEISDDFGKATLFGITTKGLYGDTSRKAVQPKKISIRTLSHTLHCQKASSYFLKHENYDELGMELVNIERGGLEKYGLTHRPDLLLRSEDEEHYKFGLVCVEVELSLKSKQRYVDILKNYFEKIQSRQINQVIYVFYDEKLANRFKNNMLLPFFKKHHVPERAQRKLDVRIFE